MTDLGPSKADPLEQIDRPVVILSSEYEDGKSTSWHIHRRSQFLFARSGTMTAYTANGSWIVPPLYGLLIPAGIAHQVKMHGFVSMQSIYVQSVKLRGVEHEDCVVLSVSPLLRACINRFAERPALYQPSDLAAHLAAIIISELNNTPPSPMALPTKPHSRLVEVWSALERDPSCGLAIDDWAMHLGMSRRTFTRAFRADTGMGFDEWRRRLRFHKANELVAAGYPLSAIAPRLGYGSTGALKAMMRSFNST